MSENDEFVHKDTFNARIDEIRAVVAKNKAEHETISAEIKGECNTMRAELDGMRNFQDSFISKANLVLNILAIMFVITQIIIGVMAFK